jgi:hypothetical protein
MPKKTRIEYVYSPPEGDYIHTVLSFDVSTTFVLRSNNNVPRTIDKLVNGVLVNSCEAPYLEQSDWDKLGRKLLFKYGAYLAVFNVNGDITLLDTTSLEVTQTMTSANMSKEDDPFKNLHFASYNEDKEELVVGIHGLNTINNSAKSLAKVVKKRSSIFSLNKKKSFNFENVKSLPLEKYPVTCGQLPPFDANPEWLNINSVMSKENSVHVHTNGGMLTRLKSGSRFEFSFITKLDFEFNWQKNYEIEEGFGCFSRDSDYFILHSRKKRNKLLFYNTSNYEIEFDVSLTPKQNMGKEKQQWLKFDFNNKHLFVYNSLFLHICLLLE